MIRRNLLAALLLAILPGASAAGSWAAQLFDKLDHDWGRVDRGAQLGHQFTLTNNSSRELRIKRLTVSCQCTQAMTSSYKIGPGESAIINAHMDTSGFQGAKSVSIFVSFDRPRFAEVTLRVSATSAGANLTGISEMDFGVVPFGIAAEKKLNLDSSGNANWQLIGIENANPHLKADLKEIERSATRVRYEVTLAVSEKAPTGVIEEKLRVKTNDARSPEITVLAKARIESKLQLTPDTIKYDTLAAGDQVSRNVVIKSAKPVKVIRAENTHGHYRVRSASEPRATQLVVLTLTVPADMSQIPDHIDLVIESDKGEHETVSLGIQR